MTTARLIVFTQCEENYGTNEAPRWKYKFGSEYLIATLSLSEVASLGQTGLKNLVNRALGLIERLDYSAGFVEYVIDWQLFYSGEFTEREELFAEFGEPYAVRDLHLKVLGLTEATEPMQSPAPETGPCFYDEDMPERYEDDYRAFEDECAYQDMQADMADYQNDYEASFERDVYDDGDF